MDKDQFMRACRDGGSALEQAMREHGHEPRFSVEADQESSMVNLVKNGVGLCLMRDEIAVAALQRKEVCIWHGAEQPCPLLFIYPRARAQYRRSVGPFSMTARATYSLSADSSALFSALAIADFSVLPMATAALRLFNSTTCSAS